MPTLLILIAVCSSTDAASWPGFLGAGASAVDPATIPTEWSPDQGISWTASIPGYGQSSPVILGDQVTVTSVEGSNKETLHITSYDLNSGKQLWDHTVASGFPEKNSVYISRAAPTPLIDQNGIYAYFESGDVIALSPAGKPLWQRSLTADYGKPTNEFGVSASPVQLDDRIAILVDDPGSAYLVALSKSDGTVLWKTDRTSRTSWSSPAVIEIGGQPQIVCSSAGSVDGYDPQTGRQLWTFTKVGGNSATTPVATGDGSFLIAASPGRRGENAELAKESNGLMAVTSANGEWRPDFKWTNASVSPSWASPIAWQGHAYWVNRVGGLFCVDVTTGETVYQQRLKESAWATPVGIGDNIYFFGKGGVTSVVAAGPEFRLIAQNAFWNEDAPPVNNVPQAEETSEERRRGQAMFSQPTLYGVAIVNGSIVARTGSQLFCIRR
jgi:outer membrane protein assembly factor BamB